MQLKFITRKEYRLIQDPVFQNELSKTYSPVYIIPEGGSNLLAVNSCASYAQKLSEDFDILCCACGTGGTLAGLIKGLNNSKKVMGFPALKGGEFLSTDINNFLNSASPASTYNNWSLITDYHFGGYAKVNSELEEFIVNFKQLHNIILDPVYTGKMMFAIYDLIKKGYFERGSRILAIHTGGIQGLNGFPELKKKLEG